MPRRSRRSIYVGPVRPLPRCSPRRSTMRCATLCDGFIARYGRFARPRTPRLSLRLITWRGCGFPLIGEHDRLAPMHVMRRWFMLSFLPIWPLRGYFVRKTSPYQHAFLAEVSFRSGATRGPGPDVPRPRRGSRPSRCYSVADLCHVPTAPRRPRRRGGAHTVQGPVGIPRAKKNAPTEVGALRLREQERLSHPSG